MSRGREPNGKPGTLMMFWDYDTQWGADRSRSGPGARWGELEFEETDRLLEMHAQFRVPACFAVVGAAALPGSRPYHDPAQVRRIHEAGHEVGSHAFHHEWLPSLAPEALQATLHDSKDALEQCTGAPVTAFVPPFNQPFDHPGRWSFSLSERKAVRGARNDLGAVCAALARTGYRFCRVAYKPLQERAAEWLRGLASRPSPLETIAGVTCARLTTPAGFGPVALSLLRSCASTGGVAVVYGHPHSLHSEGPQDERFLLPFLAEAARFRDEGLVRIALPRDLEPGGTD